MLIHTKIGQQCQTTVEQPDWVLPFRNATTSLGAMDSVTSRVSLMFLFLLRLYPSSTYTDHGCSGGILSWIR